MRWKEYWGFECRVGAEEAAIIRNLSLVAEIDLAWPKPGWLKNTTQWNR